MLLLSGLLFEKYRISALQTCAMLLEAKDHRIFFITVELYKAYRAVKIFVALFDDTVRVSKI